MPDDEFLVLHGSAADIDRLVEQGVWSIVLLPFRMRSHRAGVVYDMTEDKISYSVTWTGIEKKCCLWYELEGLQTEPLAEETFFSQAIQAELSLRLKGNAQALNLIQGAEVRTFPCEWIDNVEARWDDILELSCIQHDELRQEPEFKRSIEWLIDNQDRFQQVAPSLYLGRDLRALREVVRRQGYITLADVSRCPAL